MYVRPNFKTKKELKQAVEEGKRSRSFLLDHFPQH